MPIDSRPRSKSPAELREDHHRRSRSRSRERKKHADGKESRYGPIGKEIPLNDSIYRFLSLIFLFVLFRFVPTSKTLGPGIHQPVTTDEHCSCKFIPIVLQY